MWFDRTTQSMHVLIDLYFMFLVQVNKVKAYFKDSKFNYEGLLGISKAGAGLFKWVNAMVNYHAVAKTVEPKRKKVAEAEKNLRTASKDLAKTQEEVAKLNEELYSLNKSFAEKSTEQRELQDKAEVMERRLAAASKLIIGLSSEQSRWSQDMELLSARQVCSPPACSSTHHRPSSHVLVLLSGCSSSKSL